MTYLSNNESRLFQNYEKMNAEILLEVSTMRTESKLTCIRNGTFSNLRSGKRPIHTRQLLHPTCNLRCFITSSPLLCNVMHSLPGLQLCRPLRRKRRVMDSLIVLVQEEHPSQQRDLSLCRLHSALTGPYCIRRGAGLVQAEFARGAAVSTT